MSEISFKDLKKKLNGIEPGDYASILLIHGEEFLYKTALDTIVEKLLPESSRILNLDPMDGTFANVPRAIERINTFSFVPGKKIVVLKDSNFFYSREDNDSLFQKAKVEADNNELKKAAGYFTTFLSNRGFNFKDMENEDRIRKLGVDSNENLRWMDKILEYCRQKDITVTDQSSDMIGVLIEAIKQGFPKGHHLIITTDFAARSHRLYKIILKYGWVIDCAVPKGEKKADKIQQESILNEYMRNILSKRDKSIDKEAYYAVLDRVGFDIRNFVNELEKLVNYVGNRETITLDDVKNLLKRTRQDPVFELTNAIADRNLESSLFFMDSMLSSGIHALQVLTAMANQIRKLINAKAFTETASGKVWQKGASYSYFQKNVTPVVHDYDDQLRNRFKKWEAFFQHPDTKGKKKASKTKTGDNSDLFLMKYPKNLYPTYQLLKKSDNFSLKSLKSGLRAIGEADILMKSTAQNPRRILESIIFKICHLENT